MENVVKTSIKAAAICFAALLILSCGGGGGCVAFSDSKEPHNGGDTGGWGTSSSPSTGFSGNIGESTSGSIGATIILDQDGNSEITVTGSTPLDVKSYEFNGTAYNDANSLLRVLASSTLPDSFYIDFTVNGETAPRKARVSANGTANNGHQIFLEHQYKATCVVSIPPSSTVIMYYKNDGIDVTAINAANTGITGWCTNGTTYSGNPVSGLQGDITLNAIFRTVPWTFVTVVGSTVIGDDKFKAGSYAGCFVAGRTVTIDTFLMLDHEITQAEFLAVMETIPSNGSNGAAEGEIQPNRPVENVSWYDAIVFCNKKSIADGLTPCYTISGSTNPSVWGTVPTSDDANWNAVTCNWNANGYRLPTEAEWEYAALGGASGVSAADPIDYAGTNDESSLGNYAWFQDNSDGKTREVRKKNPNSLGLYDMSGNVYEWCWDWYSYISSSTPATGAPFGSIRIFHGGGYQYSASDCFSARRNTHSPYDRYASVGFRVCRTAN